MEKFCPTALYAIHLRLKIFVVLLAQKKRNGLRKTNTRGNLLILRGYFQDQLAIFVTEPVNHDIMLSL